MRKFIQNKLKDQKGLTLIELLAVIVILAIIAAIAIPAIGNIIENSRVGGIKSDGLNALASAELFMTDNPNYFNTGQPGTGGTGIVKTVLSPEYLDDQGSFSADDTFKVTKHTDGQLLLTGVGKIGDITVTFAGANKATINSLKNNATGAVAGGNKIGSVTVTGR